MDIEAHKLDVEIRKVRDWTVWSVLNIFLGWFILGIIALIFSIICRNKKRENDLESALKWSKAAFIVNLVSTILGITCYVIFIVFIVLAGVAVHTTV